MPEFNTRATEPFPREPGVAMRSRVRALLAVLVVEDGAVLTAPDGHLLSLTVNGVETGSVLDGTYGTTTLIAAGTYRGDIVLTPALEHTETFAGATFHRGRLTHAWARDVSLSSTGEAFNGCYAAEGASYTLTRPRITFDGNGRCDFTTYGANVIVKNSRIRTREGRLPDDVLGENTSATITGDSGYGTYADGGSQTDLFLGTHFDVATFAAISTGGSVTFADSTREAVVALDSELDLGLTARESDAIGPRASIVESRGCGVMWHSGDGGSVDIGGGTRFSTAGTMFLDKAKQVTVTVDGSQGARLHTGNGVLVQVMETDDPGSPDGVCTEPTGDPDKDDTFDPTTVHTTDATASFTDIELKGDFYNAMRTGKNLVLSFARTRPAGVVSASASRHAVSSISAANHEQINHLTNTTRPAIDNGVIVTLGAGSAWTVTGKSYLTRLVVDTDATVQAPPGRTLSPSVDGAVTTLAPGSTYSGALTLTVA
ncbi:hypothetical protein ACQEWB_01570 [Streptomyces sp. CA-249302]|uniref:hypothetical protein n=1 Tax=Streptomyces sp. CA-249302 TaxID=3240058 RepID=UPI003D8DDBB7